MSTIEIKTEQEKIQKIKKLCQQIQNKTPLKFNILSLNTMSNIDLARMYVYTQQIKEKHEHVINKITTYESDVRKFNKEIKDLQQKIESGFDTEDKIDFSEINKIENPSDAEKILKKLNIDKKK